MSEVSLLNDVIGPVMRGPSSSHTAGAYRIAKLACDIFGSCPSELECTFDPEGSYAPTYKALGVDIAFAAGCLGWEMTHSDYKDSLEHLAEAGTKLEFKSEALSHADHPNAIRIRGTIASGRQREIWARSTGGGIVEIYQLDDLTLSVDGRSWTLIAELDGISSDEFKSLSESFLDVPHVCRDQNKSAACVQIDSAVPLPDDALSKVRDIEGVSRVTVIRPVLYTQPGEAVFTSAAELAQIAQSEGMGIGDIARRYEARLLCKTEEEIDEIMLARYKVMLQSVAEGLDDSNCQLAFCSPSASSVLNAEEKGSLPAGGLHARAAARAMAAMHTCNSKGLVCAAPTGGSAGVIPGVLISLAEAEDLSDEKILCALYAAGAVGLIVARRATFAAEMAGCQVEIGVAAAMAAAAVVDVTGGTPEQACNAAAVSLQNSMGLVCDPVGGGCEIPCHTRNAAAASAALTCADIVTGGYVNPVPLDESIDASYTVGKMLPSELRCTARGGIAVTPSGQKLVRDHNGTG